MRTKKFLADVGGPVLVPAPNALWFRQLGDAIALEAAFLTSLSGGRDLGIPGSDESNEGRAYSRAAWMHALAYCRATEYLEKFTARAARAERTGA